MKFRASERPVVAASIAAAYVGLGSNDLALDWLEKAADNRSSWLVWFATDACGILCVSIRGFKLSSIVKIFASTQR